MPDPAMPDLTLAGEVLRLRLSMMIVNDLIRDGAFQVPVHLAMGHEAIACGVAAAMGPGDRLLLSHRNIHYNLALSRRFRSQIAEYRLQGDGDRGGQLGCMNFDNPEAGVAYTSSILGNNLAVAPGVALAQKVTGTGALTWVVTGDGAMEEGAFYESLLAMKSIATAAIVVVENNGWSLGSTIEERRCPIDVAALAGSLDVPYRALRGNDVTAYAATLRALRAEAHAASTPLVLEVALHSLGDWRQKTDEYPDGKYINYHAGVAPTVTATDWPAIAADDTDPVHVLTALHPEAALRALARDTLAALRQEAA